MSKSIKFKNAVYLDSSDISYNRLKLNDILDIQDDFMKIIHVRSRVTVPGNSLNSYRLLDTFPEINNYTFIGILPHVLGYADQWLCSISIYGCGVVAMIQSKYPSSLTTIIEYMLIYIKSTYYNLNHTTITN